MFVVIRLLVSLGLALLGALFFVLNSMRQKRDTIEEYDASKFWGGLWYRLGEAVLFTVVFFLAFRMQGSAEGEAALPIIALFLGMFVTSGEALVFGLAKRVLHAATALVGPPEDQAKTAQLGRDGGLGVLRVYCDAIFNALPSESSRMSSQKEVDRTTEESKPSRSVR